MWNPRWRVKSSVKLGPSSHQIKRSRRAVDELAVWASRSVHVGVDAAVANVGAEVGRAMTASTASNTGTARYALRTSVAARSPAISTGALINATPDAIEPRVEADPGNR